MTISGIIKRARERARTTGVADALSYIRKAREACDKQSNKIKLHRVIRELEQLQEIL